MKLEEIFATKRPVVGALHFCPLVDKFFNTGLRDKYIFVGIKK